MSREDHELCHILKVALRQSQATPLWQMRVVKGKRDMWPPGRNQPGQTGGGQRDIRQMRHQNRIGAPTCGPHRRHACPVARHCGTGNQPLQTVLRPPISHIPTQLGRSRDGFQKPPVPIHQIGNIDVMHALPHSPPRPAQAAARQRVPEPGVADNGRASGRNAIRWLSSPRPKG